MTSWTQNTTSKLQDKKWLCPRPGWCCFFFATFQTLILNLTNQTIRKQKKKAFWFISVPMNFTLHRKSVPTNQEVGIYSSCGLLCRLLIRFCAFLQWVICGKAEENNTGVTDRSEGEGMAQLSTKQNSNGKIKEAISKKKKKKMECCWDFSCMDVSHTHWTTLRKLHFPTQTQNVCTSW